MTYQEQMKVIISAVDPGTGRVFCRDPLGGEIQIDATLRPKGTGFPAVGEQWTICRSGNAWLLGLQMGVVAVPLIEGSRDGLHPVVSQILDALAGHGLVQDATTDALVARILTDANDPPASPAPGEDSGDDEPILVEADPDVVPLQDNGPTPVDDDDEDDREMVPLYLGTYDLNTSVGPKRAIHDLTRLTKSRVQVFGLQDVGNSSRDDLCARIGGQGWDYFRPTATTPESTIFWREGLFTKLGSGSTVLSTAGDNPGPSSRALRMAAWVHLRQEESGRDFYFLSTHLHPHIEGHNHWHTKPFSPGRPSRDPDLAQSLSDTYSAIEQLVAMMRNWGKTTPVFTAGNWNIDYFADKRVRDPRFPFAQFRATETYNNFGLIDHRPKYGTHGQRYIDSIWVTRPIHHQIRMIGHWVLTGYASDHRPVIVRASIRSKT